jgi:hypothetical protein
MSEPSRLKNLVAKEWGLREPRRMVAWLTPKGKEVVGRLLETVASRLNPPAKAFW